jgi:hypothetical protein
MHSYPVLGSPIVPIPYAIGLVLGFFFLLGLIFLVIHLTSGHIHPHKEIRRFVLASVLSVVIILAYLFYLLIPPPKVISTTPAAGAKDISQPVSRGVMDKSISPSIPGVWIFEDPLYATHLYRKVVFYPDIGLNSSTTYTVSIANIENVLRTAKSGNYPFSFSTKAARLRLPMS